MERIEWLNDGVPLLRGDKIEDQNGRIFEVRKEIGAGVLAHVYKVIETHRDGSKKVAAIKIPTNEDDSIDSIDYEGQVLDYVCILFLVFFIAIL